MKNKLFFVFLISGSILLIELVNNTYLSSVAAKPSLTLREAAATRGVFIGSNTDKPVDSYEPQYGKTIAREFNTLSTTGSMWMLVHPDKDVWDFSFLDSVVAFAQKNKMRVVATPILWGPRGVDEKGNETWNDYNPSWLNDKRTPEELRAIMREHITKLVGRYKGRIHEWVVVNEPFEWNDSADAPVTFRQDIFARKLGSVNYIAEAFKLVHALDPKAILILNEGSTHGPGQRADRFYALTKELLRRGAPVHAVGFQTHWTNFETMPAFKEMEKNLSRFAELGVEIRLTELDVMVGHLPVEERDAWQSKTYQGIVSTCLNIPACKGITFWGFTDKHNWWIDEMGYTDEQPLLFDTAYKQKPAYFAVLNELMGK